MSLWKRECFPGRTALAVLGLPAAMCILVGDRIETGMKTGLVLTGVTDTAAPEARPCPEAHRRPAGYPLIATKPASPPHHLG